MKTVGALAQPFVHIVARSPLDAYEARRAADPTQLLFLLDAGYSGFGDIIMQLAVGADSLGWMIFVEQPEAQEILSHGIQILQHRALLIGDEGAIEPLGWHGVRAPNNFVASRSVRRKPVGTARRGHGRQGWV